MVHPARCPIARSSLHADICLVVARLHQQVCANVGVVQVHIDVVKAVAVGGCVANGPAVETDRYGRTRHRLLRIVQHIAAHRVPVICLVGGPRLRGDDQMDRCEEQRTDHK